MSDLVKQSLILGVLFGLVATLFLGLPVFLFVLWLGFSGAALYLTGFFFLCTIAIAGSLYLSSALLLKNNASYKEYLKSQTTLYLDGPANRVKIISMVAGGWLYLTQEGIWFKSHKFNFQNQEFLVPYDQIKAIGKANHWGVAPVVFTVTTKGGETIRFFVSNRNKWLETICAQL